MKILQNLVICVTLVARNNPKNNYQVKLSILHLTNMEFTISPCIVKWDGEVTDNKESFFSYHISLTIGFCYLIFYLVFVK